MEHANGTVAFLQAIAPLLIANSLTVVPNDGPRPELVGSRACS